MNPSTRVSHNSLRIYCTSFFELVSARTSVELCSSRTERENARSTEIMALNLLDFLKEVQHVQHLSGLCQIVLLSLSQ